MNKKQYDMRQGWQNSVNLGHLSAKTFCNSYAKRKLDIKTSQWLINSRHQPPSGQGCELQSAKMTDGLQNFLALVFCQLKTQNKIHVIDENILLIRPVAPVLLCISTHGMPLVQLKYLVETNCFMVYTSYGTVVLSWVHVLYIYIYMYLF